MYKTNYNALPVVDAENKLCGIISKSDLFRAFVEIMGMNRTSTRITIDVKDKVGVVAEISKLFKDNDINIISIASRQDSETGAYEVIIRADLSECGMGIIEQIREAGYEVADIMTFEGINK